jgi:hypothetical protein
VILAAVHFYRVLCSFKKDTIGMHVTCELTSQTGFKLFRHKNNKSDIRKCNLYFIILFLADLIYSLTTAIFGDRTSVW